MSFLNMIVLIPVDGPEKQFAMTACYLDEVLKLDTLKSINVTKGIKHQQDH